MRAPAALSLAEEEEAVLKEASGQLRHPLAVRSFLLRGFIFNVNKLKVRYLIGRP